MVTPYQEKIKRKNLMQTMIDSAKVQWMFLEDAQEQCRDQFLMESTNSGVVSALLLSCMFSYMMTIPDMDWDIIAEQWGAATIWDSKNSTGDPTGDSSLPVWIRFGVKSGEEVAKIHRDVLTLFSFLSFVTFLVACINSLIGTFMMGETTGDLEARIWIDALGFKAKSSFIFLLAGILWLAIVVLYHYFIYCYFVVTILLGFGFAIVVIVGALHVPRLLPHDAVPFRGQGDDLSEFANRAERRDDEAALAELLRERRRQAYRAGYPPRVHEVPVPKAGRAARGIYQVLDQAHRGDGRRGDRQLRQERKRRRHGGRDQPGDAGARAPLMALPSSADCECGPLRGKGMRERGAAYVIRARRCDRDRAEHARGGEESVAAVDTKRWRGGKIGEGASRVSRDVRITQIVPATDRGEGGVINQRTEAGRNEVCVCGVTVVGGQRGRLAEGSQRVVCACVLCV